MNKLLYFTGLIFTLITVAVGVLIILNPAPTVVIITTIISILMILTGIIGILFYFNIKDMQGALYYLIKGIIALILGIIIITNESALKNLVPYIIAVWVLLESVSGIMYAVDIKRRGFPSWSRIMAVSILGIILAGLIIAFPVIVQFYISFIVGGFFVLMGIIMFILMIMTRKAVRTINENNIDVY